MCLLPPAWSGLYFHHKMASIGSEIVWSIISKKWFLWELWGLEGKSSAKKIFNSCPKTYLIPRRIEKMLYIVKYSNDYHQKWRWILPNLDMYSFVFPYVSYSRHRIVGYCIPNSIPKSHFGHSNYYRNIYSFVIRIQRITHYAGYFDSAFTVGFPSNRWFIVSFDFYWFICIHSSTLYYTEFIDYSDSLIGNFFTSTSFSYVIAICNTRS